MKAPTSILVICFAVTLANIGWAQTVKDRGGKEWTCRPDPDGNIYKRNGRQIHIYDIAAAKTAHETGHADDHKPLCIDALSNHRIIWSWTGAKHINVKFTPLTDDRKDKGTCWNSQLPFGGTPNDDSGDDDFLVSLKADDDLSGCAYEMKFQTSNKGDYDPHIIINGSHNDTREVLEDLLTEAKDRETKLQAIIDLRAQQKK